MSAFQCTFGDTFTLPAYLQAETIHLVGAFNGWNWHSHPLQRTATGQWTIGWPRPACCRRFYLLLDRTRWLTVDSIDFLLLEHWHALPPSTLFTWAGQSMAIGQFLAWIERWCDTLAYVGVAKGAVVALPPADSPSAMALWLALFRRQAIVVPLVQNTRRSCPQHSMSPAFSTNDWPVPVEWVVEWQADDAARYVRCSTTTAHRTIQHLRSLGHPGLLYCTGLEQRQFRIIDLIDYWMPDAFRHLRQAGQSGFSSAVVPGCRRNCLKRAWPAPAVSWRIPPLLIRTIKKATQEGLALALPAALGVELSYYNLLVGSADSRAGIHAFAEKCQLLFQG